ncbi:MAG: enoyl-CoA hydratase/isomerase family protein [Bryobacterales bacterium]|nr:enoyl-CoA hydratase/isomerase family protein [Bryobacterales bacterium]
MSIRVEQDGRLRRITLAAPEKRNLLDAALCQDLLAILRAAAADDTVGAILLDAEGPVFCSGIDAEAGADLFTIGRRISKPLVAAVKGVALSGGLALLANAHVVLAAQGSSFGLTDIREGVWNKALYRAVAGAIGERRARELSLTGRVFSTPDALSWGLVHMVAPAFELDERATEVATALANANANAIRTAFSS